MSERKSPPADIPGFFYDVERNRYFPIKKCGSERPGAGPCSGSGSSRLTDQPGGKHGAGASSAAAAADTTPRHCHGCVRSTSGFAATAMGGGHAHWEEAKAVSVKSSLKGLVMARQLVGSQSSHSACSSGTRSFQRRIMEACAERPMVWEEEGLLRSPTSALVDVPLVVGSNAGEWRGSGLLVGGPYGELLCVGVSAARADEDACRNDEPSIGSLPGGQKAWLKRGAPPLNASRNLFRWTFGSDITALRRWRVTAPVEQQRVIGSSMGCGDVPARLFVIQVDAAYQPCPDMQVIMGLYVYQFAKQTLWTVEGSPNGSDVAIGTGNSAELFNVDTKARVSLIKNCSAVLSQQFSNDGQVLLCGFRNGTISTLDRRQAPPDCTESQDHWGSSRSGDGRPSSSSAPSSSRTHGSRSSSGRSTREVSGQRHGRERDEREALEEEASGVTRRRYQSGKRWHSRRDFQSQRQPTSASNKRLRTEVNELYCSHTPTMRMGSAVCSMKLLRSSDNYLLASAMNGTISQWDRRMVKSPVRNFEGHSNSFMMLQMDVDPTETLLISGSEDKMVQIWSLTSGKLIHSVKGFSSPVVALSWTALKDKGTNVSWGYGEQWQGTAVEAPHAWGAWLGSSDGVKYMGAAAAGGGPSGA